MTAITRGSVMTPSDDLLHRSMEGPLWPLMSLFACRNSLHLRSCERTFSCQLLWVQQDSESARYLLLLIRKSALFQPLPAAPQEEVMRLTKAVRNVPVAAIAAIVLPKFAFARLRQSLQSSRSQRSSSKRTLLTARRRTAKYPTRTYRVGFDFGGAFSIAAIDARRSIVSG
jgi:hypothetical protein